jgi:23S rRNA (adenine2503-C2)-methyltransferase
MHSFYEYTRQELERFLVQHKYKAFSAKQIFSWIYKKRMTDINKMSDLSISLRQFLIEHVTVEPLRVASRQISSDGTQKFLLELADGNLIETVLMRHNYGNSVCVTSQIGCNIGCTFCASGLQKKQRDLTAGEIVNQVLTVQDIVGERISHVVIMGIGEPFDNYEETLKFIDIINDPHGLEIGARHITVSTSGIVPKIYEFAKETRQVNLAISLHAPNDDIRSSIMKINNVYPISDVIDAAKHYIQVTNRRVTFEYILLEGINDELRHADELSDLIRGMNAYVNLIRYNEVAEFGYKGSGEDKAVAFHHRLMDRGITATLRHEKGGDIDAACGQLRSKNLKEN